MKEYVEREAAIKAAQDGADVWDGGYSKYRDRYIRRAINDIPAADVVEVRHGQWIGTEYDGYADGHPIYDVFECSVCGCEYDTDDGEMRHNYCPNCGARMDMEEDDT